MKKMMAFVLALSFGALGLGGCVSPAPESDVDDTDDATVEYDEQLYKNCVYTCDFGSCGWDCTYSPDDPINDCGECHIYQGREQQYCPGLGWIDC